MKNKRIIRAYDSINPTNSDRERMLSNILAQANLEEDTGMQRRRVRPDVRPTRKTKSFRAGRLLPFTACFAALLLGGFLLSRLGASQENPVVVDPTSESAVHGMTAMHHYAPVLEKYRRAMEEGWTKEQCEIEGISLRMHTGADLTKAGYALLDLDGDGREELIIAEESLPHMDQVWDLYTTLEDGTPIQLWVDECDGNQCNLYVGNIIGTENSGKTKGESVYHTLESGQLVERERIEYEDDSIIHMDTEGNIRPISNQEFMEISNSYAHLKLSLTWLADKPDYLRDTDTMERYLPILEKYRTALTEHWTKEQCQIEGISPNMQYVTSKTGYALLDMSGDGKEELIIAQEISSEHDIVWDLYTILEDGTPIHLWSDEQDFIHCRIYRNNIICISHEEDQPGEHDFYTLEDGRLVLLESIDYEGDDIIHTDAEGNPKPISSQEAMEIVFGYKHQKLDLIWLQDDLTDLQDADSVDPYAPVLEKYKTALTENWSREQCDQNDISRQIMFDTTNRNDLGWCIMDMDQNGIDELVISDGTSLFDLYTLQNGLPVQILSGYPDSYTLCADGTVQMHTLFSKGCSWSFYVLSDQKLELKDILVYRNEYEGTKATERYYFGSDGDNVQPISKEEAGDLIVSTPMELELTPFMEKHASDPTSDYQNILEQYQTALMEKWDPGKCVEHDISLMVANFTETPDRLCAFYLDLDGDGLQELMITDGMMIFDLYTMKNSQPVHLLTGWERNSYRYCLDNVIFNHASNSAFNSSYRYYRMENGVLVLADAIVFDASKDPDNPWFLSADGETPGEAITEQKAREIMDQYVDMTILGIPILQLP